MSTLGRNAPCPCGSGKRYKECHGAIPGAAPSVAPVADAWQEQLQAALAAQQAGRYGEAIALYEAVISRQPGVFDALHMLGVVHYQCGHFDRARELVASALSLAPSNAGARFNLRLIESALERRVIEREICRETLPRLARRCIAPTLPDDDRRWRGAALDLIVSGAESRDPWPELERLVRWLAATQPTVWLYPGMSHPADAPWPVRVIDPAAGATPMHRKAVFVGADRSPAPWGMHVAADVTLYCDDAAPCLLLDRIPELAREGRTPLRLLFASAALARRIGLPGLVVAGAAVPA